MLNKCYICGRNAFANRNYINNYIHKQASKTAPFLSRCYS